ncbi:MAG: RNA-binding protein, partial [Chitinophagaceae bacterium]|nr:RNA-binding protein [Chitinophagaceae bacterium]
VGWWNSFVAGDFDNDGDIDYVVGNLGTNSYLRASYEYPVRIYEKDFDNNNKTEIIPTTSIKDENGVRREFTVNNRDEIIEQLPGLKKKFLTYKEFGRADIRAVLGQQLDEAFTLQANYFKSSYLQNEGNGRFTMKALPAQFQLAPIYGMIAEDLNADGYLDLVASGNDYGNEVANGRYDALNGIVAFGDGKGNFIPKRVDSAGLYIPGDGKALVKLKGPDDKLLVAASQNRGPLKLFRSNSGHSIKSLMANDQYVVVHLKTGGARKEEVYHGSSFLSQSAPLLFINSSVDSMDIFDRSGVRRTVRPN